MDKRYYEKYNVNDYYSIKSDVLEFLEEFELFDERLKKFLGPKKVKVAATDSRRSIRKMRSKLEDISKKIQKTRQDYESDYEDY